MMPFSSIGLVPLFIPQAHRKKILIPYIVHLQCFQQKRQFFVKADKKNDTNTASDVILAREVGYCKPSFVCEVLISQFLYKVLLYGILYL